VYGSRATSQTTPNSGLTFFEILTALHIKLSLLRASLPSGVYNDSSIFGKKAIAGMPNEEIYSISLWSKSNESLCIPGIDPTSSLTFEP
jgi:hypothetical protein